ncbi:MAG: hypothetical protein HY613_00900 [Candidatus Rokubacteria bacterium]|nr:hypothetical protein [Candidatus Rokubacteria bacterium]
MGHLIAESLGLPGLPFVMLPHPLSGLSEAAVRAKAQQAAETALRVLTSPRESLEHEFTNTLYPMPTGVCPKVLEGPLGL